MKEYKKILKIHPYEKGIWPKNKENIKLNTNENPYHPNLNVLKNILKEIFFFGNVLKFYPDDESIIIKEEISKKYNIKKEMIFIGNGSDDVLSKIFMTFLKNKKILYLIDLTYSFYESFIRLYKIKYKIIRIKNFLTEIKKIIKNKNNIIINNPNAPTGKIIQNIEIKTLVKNIKSTAIIDETYIDFESTSIIKIVKKYKNIIIVQTFSKASCLAGVRIGFAVSSQKLIKKLNITKNSLNSYPINTISQISIKNIYKNNKYFNKIKNKIKKNKIFLLKNIKKIGFLFLKSSTNFILIKNNNININKLQKYLNNKNIFTRKFELPKIENYLRISIGKLKECKILIKNIKNFIKHKLKKNLFY